MTVETFNTESIASIYTGVLLCAFSEMHQDMEILAGGSVWTHQMPEMMDMLKDDILAHVPKLKEFRTEGVNKDNYLSYVNTLHELVGETVDLPVPLLNNFEADPLKGLAKVGNNVSVVVVDK